MDCDFQSDLPYFHLCRRPRSAATGCDHARRKRRTDPLIQASGLRFRLILLWWVGGTWQIAARYVLETVQAHGALWAPPEEADIPEC
jgi:hypothetical protein